MKEQGRQTKIIKALKDDGAYVVKVMTASKNGVHDVIACVPIKISAQMVGETVGIFSSFEVKDVNGEPSPLQNYNRKKVLKSGGIAGVVKSVSDVFQLINSRFG